MPLKNKAGGSGGDKLNGIIEQYKISAGNNISAGDFVQFVDGISEGTAISLSPLRINGFTKAIKLSDTRVLMSFKNYTNNNGIILLISVTSSSISVLQNLVFDTYGEVYGLLMVSETSIIVLYYDATGYAVARFITISSDVITVNTKYTLSDTIISALSGTLLSVSVMLIAYKDYDGVMKSRVVAISGTTLVPKTIYNSADYTFASNYNMSAITSTRALMTYYRNDAKGTAVIFTVSGNTVTKTTPWVYSDSAINTRQVQISNYLFLLVYYDNLNNSYGTAQFVGVATDTPRGKSKVVFSAVSSDYFDVLKVSEEKAIVLYEDMIAYKGKVKTLYLSNMFITVGAENTVVTDERYVSAALCGSNIVKLYSNRSDNDNATIRPVILVNDIKKATTYPANGVAKVAGYSGQTIDVFVPNT